MKDVDLLSNVETISTLINEDERGLEKMLGRRMRELNFLQDFSSCCDAALNP